MAQSILDYVLKRLDFNEERVREAKKRIKELEFYISTIDKELNMHKGMLGEVAADEKSERYKLLTSEKHRYDVGVRVTNTNAELAKLFGVNERTVYRKLDEYGLSR